MKELIFVSEKSFETKNIIIGQVDLQSSINKLNIIEVPLNKRVPISQQPSSSSQFYNTKEVQISMSVLFNKDDIFWKYIKKSINPQKDVIEEVKVFTGLEALLQQFEVTPFITIYNEELQKLINPKPNPNSKQLPYQTNVVLNSLSYQTIEDMPGAIVVNMSFLQLDLGSMFNSLSPNFVAYKLDKDSNNFTQQVYKSDYFQRLIIDKINEKHTSGNYNQELTLSNFVFEFDIPGGLDKQIDQLNKVKELMDEVLLQSIDSEENKKFLAQKETTNKQIESLISEINSYKEKYLNSEGKSISIKPSMFKVGYENHIQPINVTSISKMKKYSYLGRTGLNIEIQFMAENIEQVSELNYFIDTLVEYSEVLKRFGLNQPLIFQNPFLNQLIGDKDFYLDIVQESNIDESPGQFIVDMYLVQHNNDSLQGYVIDENKIFTDTILKSLWTDINNIDLKKIAELEYFKDDINTIDFANSQTVKHYYIQLNKSSNLNVIKNKILRSNNLYIDLFIEDSLITENKIDELIPFLSQEVINRLQSINIYLSPKVRFSNIYKEFNKIIKDPNKAEYNYKQVSLSDQESSAMTKLLNHLETVNIDLINIDMDSIQKSIDYLSSKVVNGNIQNAIFINPVHYQIIDKLHPMFKTHTINKNNALFNITEFFRTFQYIRKSRNYNTSLDQLYAYMLNQLFFTSKNENTVTEMNEYIYTIGLNDIISTELIPNTNDGFGNNFDLRDYILYRQTYNGKIVKNLKKFVAEGTADKILSINQSTIILEPVDFTNIQTPENIPTDEHRFSIFDYKDIVEINSSIPNNYYSFDDLKQKIDDVQKKYFKNNTINESISDLYSLNIVLYKSLLLSQKFIKNILDDFIEIQNNNNNSFEYNPIYYVPINYVELEVKCEEFIQNMVQIINYNLNLQQIKYNINADFQYLILLHQMQDILVNTVLDEDRKIYLQLLAHTLYKENEDYVATYLKGVLGTSTLERSNIFDSENYPIIGKKPNNLVEGATILEAINKCSEFYDRDMQNQIDYKFMFDQYYQNNSEYFDNKIPAAINNVKHLSDLNNITIMVTQTLNTLNSKNKGSILTDYALELIKKREDDERNFNYDPTEIFQSVVPVDYKAIEQTYKNILDNEDFIDALKELDKALIQGKDAESINTLYENIAMLLKGEIKTKFNTTLQENQDQFRKDDVYDILEIFINQIDTIGSDIEKIHEDIITGGSTEANFDLENDSLINEDMIITNEDDINQIELKYNNEMQMLESKIYQSDSSTDFEKYSNIIRGLINEIYGYIYGLNKYQINISSLQPKQAIAFLQRDLRYVGDINKYFENVTRLFYKDVLSFQVNKSKTNPAHTATIMLQNTNQNILLQDEYTDTNILIQSLGSDYISRITTDIIISPGTEIQLYQGTGKSIYDLDLIFQGKIQQLEINEVVSITQDSYGADLLNPVDQTEQNTTAKLYINPTDLALASLFDSKSYNLGSYKGLQTDLLVDSSLLNNIYNVMNYQLKKEYRDLGVNIYYPTEFYHYHNPNNKYQIKINEWIDKNQIFRNIFFNFSGEIVNNPYRYIDGYTYWDIINDAQLRIPDFVQYVDDFGVGQQRLFFGKRNWNYHTNNYVVLPEEENAISTKELKEKEFKLLLDSIGINNFENLKYVMDLDKLTTEEIEQSKSGLKNALGKADVNNEIIRLVDKLKYFYDDQLQFIKYVNDKLGNQKEQDLTDFNQKFQYFTTNYPNNFDSLYVKLRLFQKIETQLSNLLDYETAFSEPFLENYPAITNAIQNWNNEYNISNSTNFVYYNGKEYQVINTFKPNNIEFTLYINRDTNLYKSLSTLDSHLLELMFTYTTDASKSYKLITQFSGEKTNEDYQQQFQYQLSYIHRYIGSLSINYYSASLSEQLEKIINTEKPLSDEYTEFIKENFYGTYRYDIIKNCVPLKDKIINDLKQFIPIVQNQLYTNTMLVDSLNINANIVNIISQQNYKKELDKRIESINNMSFKSIYTSENLKYLTNYIDNLNAYLLQSRNQDFFLRLDIANILAGYEPFQKTYYLSDRLNIIENRLQTNYNNVQTQFNVYGRDGFVNNKGWFNAFLTMFSKQQDHTEIDGVNYVITKQLLDNNIPDYLNVQQHYIDQNAFTSPVRKIIQQNKLSESLRDFYEGSITIIGNPKIKPYDNIDILDIGYALEGTAEVKSVNHLFDIENGFITVITPQMRVDTSLPENIAKTWNSYQYLKSIVIGGLFVSTLIGFGQPIWLGGLMFFASGQIANSIGKDIVLNHVDPSQTGNMQQHTLETIYNSAIVNPLSLKGRLLTPKFEHYKFEPLDRYSIVNQNFTKQWQWFGRGLKDVFTRGEYITFED